MSSEQFSQKPLPARKKKVCPACGEVAPSPAAVACWLCGEKFAVEDPAPEPDGTSAASAHAGKARPEWLAWVIFGIVAVILGIGLTDRAPGVLCLLLVLAVPVILGFLVSRSSSKAGQSGPRSFLNGLLVAFGVLGVTIGVIAIVLMIAIASFVAAIGSICTGGHH